MYGVSYKFFWTIRAIIYKIIGLDINFPSYIGKPIFLVGIKNIKIGSKFRIFPGARIEIKKKANLVIEDDVSIAQNLHLTCGKKIVIKKGACIAPNVCITDTIHNYKNIKKNILKQKDKYKVTIIKENVFIGFGAIIDAGSIIGKNSVIGSNVYVKGIVPDHSVVQSSKNKIIKKYNTIQKKWINN